MKTIGDELFAYFETTIHPDNEIVFSEDFLASIKAKLPLKKFRSKYDYKIRLENLKGLGKTKFYRILTKLGEKETDKSHTSSRL